MTSNDIHIINKLKNGETKALGPLMEQYGKFVLYILRDMLSPVESQEAVQDTFLKVYKNINKYNSNQKFSTWLYTIAYRTGLDYIRKKKLNSVDINAPHIKAKYFQEKERITTSIEHEEWQEKIKSIFNRFGEKDSTLLKLYYLQEHSIKELAQITNLSPSNIKVKLYRLRKQLQTLLKRNKALAL